MLRMYRCRGCNGKYVRDDTDPNIIECPYGCHDIGSVRMVKNSYNDWIDEYKFNGILRKKNKKVIPQISWH